MREIVHLQAGQCGNQIGSKVREKHTSTLYFVMTKESLLTHLRKTLHDNQACSALHWSPSVTMMCHAMQMPRTLNFSQTSKELFKLWNCLKVKHHFDFSFGRLSLMSTELTQPAPTLAPPTFSWRGSTSTTMRPAGASMCPEPCWWTWSPAPWTVSGEDPLVRSSDLTTLCLDSLELATTGPRY